MFSKAVQSKENLYGGVWSSLCCELRPIAIYIITLKEGEGWRERQNQKRKDILMHVKLPAEEDCCEPKLKLVRCLGSADAFMSPWMESITKIE